MLFWKFMIVYYVAVSLVMGASAYRGWPKDRQ